MYKKLVQMLIDTQTQNDILCIYGENDIAYQREKISYKDYEQLYKLFQKVDKLMQN